MRTVWIATALASLVTVAAVAEGRSEAPVPRGTIAFLSDRSPDRAGEIYAVDTRKRVRRSLSQGPAVADYAATPSGNRRRLAFVSSRGGTWAIWVTGTRRARPARVALLPRQPIEPTIDWDPSGRRLVHDHGLAEGDRHEVWTTLPRRRIGRGAWRPDWSPLGGRIAYETYRGDEDDSRVVVVSPRGRVLWRRRGFLPSWSPDGRLLAFVTPGGRLALTTPEGRIVRRIWRRVDAYQWLPGDNQLALFGREIWIVTTTGRLVRTVPQEGPIVPSPDGRRIAYVTRGRLLVAPLRGTPRRVAGSIAFAMDWSPDGRRILALRPGRSPRLVEIRADGGGARAIVTGSPGSEIRSGFWHGNSRVIYENHAARAVDVYLRPPGGAERRLTRKEGQYAFPQWSPDGMRIAASSIPPCEKFCPAELAVIDGTTGRGYQITHPPQDEDLPYAEAPTWSPDGNWIAFARTGPPGFVISVVPVSGGRERVLFRFPTEGAWTRFPSWSPSGQQLAFLGEDEVYVMSADGSGARSLGPAGSRPLSTTWSPDGRRIAWRVGATIRVVAADGSLPPTVAVRRPELVCGMAGEASPPGLTWSSDGSRFIFGGCGGSGSLRADLDLWSVRTDGTGLTRLTNSVASEWSPTLR